MAEKRGKTVKIKYDFDTSKNLEIWLPALGDWYRSTPTDFRSFNGSRRIENVKYIGPIYAYGTNKKVEPADYPRNKIVEHNFDSKKRQFEKF